MPIIVVVVVVGIVGGLGFRQHRKSLRCGSLANDGCVPGCFGLLTRFNVCMCVCVVPRESRREVECGPYNNNNNIMIRS